MSKNMIIAGRDCSNCKHCKVEKSVVYCFAKNKKYFYGQYIPCDVKEKKNA